MKKQTKLILILLVIVGIIIFLNYRNNTTPTISNVVDCRTTGCSSGYDCVPTPMPMIARPCTMLEKLFGHCIKNPVQTYSCSILPNMPNPASLYCESNKGTLQIMTKNDGSQYGICFFSDGSNCEEWAYYRGECKIGDNTFGISCQTDNDCPVKFICVKVECFTTPCPSIGYCKGLV